MDPKYKKFLIIGGVAAALLVAGIFIFAPTGPNETQNPPGNNTNNEIPDYFLAADEEEALKEFVKTFVELYNTYSKDDLSNPIALGDYQTAALQERTLALVETLEMTLPEGYEKSARANPETFSYTYPSADSLFASISASVTETGQEPYQIETTLQIYKDGKRFYVNTLEIKIK
jgi:hypothetical protein